MPSYRVTVRYGGPRMSYEVLDIEASDLRAALRRAADRVPEDVVATAELAEVRVQVDEEDRAEFTTLTQENFDVLFAHDNVTVAEFLSELVRLMVEHETLSRYVQS